MWANARLGHPGVPAEVTPEALTALIRRNDADGIAAQLSSLDETARRALAPHAYAAYRALARGDAPPVGEEGLIGKLLARGAPSAGDSYRMLCAAGVAVLGCCPLPQVKRIRFYDPRNHAEAIVKVVSDRRPSWASAWLDHCVDARDFPLLNWEMVRRLVLEGICQPPESPGYARLMALNLAQWNHAKPGEYVPISAKLRAAPDLLERTVWRLFETETLAFGTDWLSRRKDLPAAYETWPQALARLAGAGLLDRSRLLDASLEALWRSDNGTYLGNMCRFHALLAPTNDESAARAERYAELLRHRTGHVVGFALTHIAALLDRGVLRPAGVIPRLTAVFELRAKAHPLAAFKILRRGLAQDAALASSLLPAIEAALLHPAAEVQSTALDLLEQCATSQAGAGAALLSKCADDLTPAVRARVDAILDPSQPAAAAPAAGPALPDPRIAALPDDLRERLGLGAQATGAELPPPLRFSTAEIHQLAEASPIPPITDLDALIASASHAIELAEHAGEIERLADGISRLCAERPADFDLRTEALGKRLAKRGHTEVSHGIIAWGTPSGLHDLLVAWLRRTRRTPPVPGYLQYRGPVRLFQRRMRELCGRVARGIAAPLLAAPTHEGGWIDPQVLVERLRETQARGLVPMPMDLQQALLRLAPDSRSTALKAAEGLDGWPGRVLRYALGAAAGPAAADRRWAPIWVAAARARRPDQDAGGSLAVLRLPGDWPGLLAPARYAWRSGMKEIAIHRQIQRLPSIEIDLSPAFPRRSLRRERTWVYYHGLRGLARQLRDTGLVAMRALGRVGYLVLDALRSGQAAGPLAFPTVAVHEPVQRSWRLVGYTAAWSIELMGWTQPDTQDALFASAVPLILGHIDAESSATEPNHPFLLPLLPTDRAWSDMGRLVLCLGLVSRDSTLRSAATEVLIAGIEDGRAHPDELAQTLARIAEGGWLKRKRLAASLRLVARNSALHALTAALIVERMLQAAGKASSEDLPLLELLHECLIDLDRPPQDALRPILAPITGSTKTAQLSQRLATMPNSGAGARHREALDAAVQVRIARGERWPAPSLPLPAD